MFKKYWKFIFPSTLSFLLSVIRLKKEVGEEKFFRISLIFIVLASASVCTSVHKLYWDIGLSFCYLGYFAIGYVLRKRAISNKNKYKNNICGFILIILGIGIEVIIGYIKYRQIINKISDDTLTNPYSPLVVIASICIFKGISEIQIGKRMEKIAELTFFIYLVHAGIWDIFAPRIDWMNARCSIAIPSFIVLVFFASLVISFFLKRMRINKGISLQNGR